MSISVSLNEFIANNYHYRLGTISYRAYNRTVDDFIDTNIIIPENSITYQTADNVYELRAINVVEFFITITVENFEIITNFDSVKGTAIYQSSNLRAFVNGIEYPMDTMRLVYKYGDSIDFYIKNELRNTVSTISLTGEKQLKTYQLVRDTEKFEYITLEDVDYEVFHITIEDELYKYTSMVFVVESEFVTVNICFANTNFAKIDTINGYFKLTDTGINSVCDLATGQPITDYNIAYRNSYSFRLYIDGSFRVDMFADSHYHITDIGVKNNSNNFVSIFGSEWTDKITMNGNSSAVYNGDYDTAKEILIIIEIDTYKVTINKNDINLGGRFRYMLNYANGSDNSIYNENATFNANYGSTLDLMIYEYLSQN